MLCLGTNENTKTDVFSEKFQMAFDPPPRFRKIILQIFYNGYKAFKSCRNHMQVGMRARTFNIGPPGPARLEAGTQTVK